MTVVPRALTALEAARKRIDDGNASADDFRMLDTARAQHNPTSEPVGHFTGRCGLCGSKDLWSDNSCYGCNACGRFYGGA